MADKLTALHQMTTVVADTGDIDTMKCCQPQDATTNPSLILSAAQLPQYRTLIDDAVAWARQQSQDRVQQLANAGDKLAGYDRLTIAPALLKELSETKYDVPCKLVFSGQVFPRPQPINEAEFL